MTTEHAGNATAGPRVLCIGPYPAHYMRVFHLELEQRHGGQIAFFYVRDQQNKLQRSYERGAFPKASRVWDSTLRDTLSLLTAVAAFRPDVVYLNSLYPRPILWAFLWYRLRRGTAVAFWLDKGRARP